MTPTPLRAFHNDPALKHVYTEQVDAHRAKDEIIHGTYWQNGKGCAAGCTIQSNKHADYETLLGIPEMIAHLEDDIFKLLMPPWDQTWPGDFLDAIPVGAYLGDVTRQFLLRLLTDPDHGVLQYVTAPQWNVQRDAIEGVANLLRHQATAGAAADAAWAAWAAADTARAAAEAAVGAARARMATGATWAARAAAGAARAAADAAVDAAVDAARAAAGAARAAAGATGTARAAILWQRGLLLEILRAAPTTMPQKHSQGDANDLSRLQQNARALGPTRYDIS